MICQGGGEMSSELWGLSSYLWKQIVYSIIWNRWVPNYVLLVFDLLVGLSTSQNTGRFTLVALEWNE